MRYPQTFIEDLKNQADIVRIVGDYLQLKKKGGNYWACCPFHGEKTASFSVSPKGFFNCFGCSKKGSVFTFVMEIENVTFPEAIKIVADKMNIPLPKPIDDKQFEAREKQAKIKKQEAELIVELNTWAMEFWENLLTENNVEAKIAREYIEKRGISEETNKAFRLGYALDSWDALLGHLRKKGADDALIEKSGLVSKNEEKNRIYDRFRGRVIFPVLDEKGRPVAFGARIINQGEPKYLNSPETVAYTKGKSLYGLWQNKEEIRKKKFAILVEGYLDLITPFQYGIRNLVASLGTAFTPEQAKLLSRFARKVVVNYDGDKAGVKAAQRAIETLLAADFEIKILVLPNGADPDEFIRTNSAEAYHKHRGQAFPAYQFILDQTVKERNLFNPSEKAAAIEDVLPYVRVVRNPVQKREFFDSAMSHLRVEDTVLREDLWKNVKLGAAAEHANLQRSVARAVQAKPTVAEQQLLELLVHDAELRKIVLPQLEPTDYEPLAFAGIFQAFLTLEKLGAGFDMDNLLNQVEDDALATDFIPVLLMSEPQRAADEAIDDVLILAEKCLLALRSMALTRKIQGISRQIAETEARGEFEKRDQLVIEQINISRMKLELDRTIH
jgi:DNA primase